MRHHTSLRFATCLAVLGASASLAAEEITWVVGANAGYSEFRFREKIDTSIAFPTYGLSATASWRRNYVTVAFGGSFLDANVSEEDFTGDADRRDFDIAIGRQVTDRIGVFAGWKDGRTELSLEPRDEDLPQATERYGQEGPYLGASFTQRTDAYGNFSFSLAYAWLDADNRFVADGDGADEGELPEFDDLTGSVNGDSRGFSYGLTWTKPLGAELLYRAQLKVNDYEQDLDFGGLNFDGVDQRFTSFTMGLSYVF